jgi:hypothetical protein
MTWVYAGGKSCQSLIDEYIKRCGKQGLAARHATARAQLLLDPSQPAKAASHLASCDLSSLPHTVHEAAQAHAWLRDTCKDKEAAKAFYAKAQEVHRWSEVFDGPDRLPVPADEGLSERLQAMSGTPAAAAAQSKNGIEKGKQVERAANEGTGAEVKAHTAAIPVDAQPTPA